MDVSQYRLDLGARAVEHGMDKYKAFHMAECHLEDWFDLHSIDFEDLVDAAEARAANEIAQEMDLLTTDVFHAVRNDRPGGTIRIDKRSDPLRGVYSLTSAANLPSEAFDTVECLCKLSAKEKRELTRLLRVGGKLI